MLIIIIPAVIGTGLGLLGAWGAALNKREEEKERKEEERRRADRQLKKRESHQSRFRMAEKFIKTHGLKKVTPEELMDRATRGSGDVMRVMKEGARWAPDLRKESAAIRKLEREKKEIKDLVDVIERGGHP